MRQQAVELPRTAATDDGSPVRRVRRPRSLSAMVVNQLRELIIEGQIDLGEQLSENVLAERLGVSRTPVREAFMKLAAERLVEVRPQRGTFVFTCTADEVREICELRAILESGALRLGAARDRAGLVTALARAADAAEPALLQSAQAYQPHDSAFHDTLMAFAGNAHLVEAYQRIAGRVRTLRWRYTRTLDEVAESQANHREVIRHIAAGDDEAAEAALRDHVHKSHRGFQRRHEADAAAGITSSTRGGPA
ncbi:MAG: GntR family transcriptional regulator [Geminicoccaceae bacterium]|jgi:DNA-binding GntR family transcriptional regulator|nr:GntR family transcriptional regulator [Geminicoccaceae bacterium]MCB9968280.1 GntR family transcriptional regulator [Geminicoccaceae bacterium]HRY26463.1 GntR family transcriptional regulator [Geminicoccaceae bacterium]